MTTWAFKNIQYGYHGKNGKVSDQTERTYWEYYSNEKPDLKELCKNFDMFKSWSLLGFD